MTALALHRVSVSLGGARILDRLSWQVEAGEWVALIGPNGAGKTPALRAVAGLVRFDGALRVFEHDAAAIARTIDDTGSPSSRGRCGPTPRRAT